MGVIGYCERVGQRDDDGGGCGEMFVFMLVVEVSIIYWWVLVFVK